VQIELGQVFAIGEAMEWAVEIGAGVGHQLDLADLELGTLGVDLARRLAAEEIADDWRRQALVGDHAVLDRMAHVDQHRLPP
jgi:hypothetical protein